MKKSVVLLFVLSVSIQTMLAHNPLSALYYLEANEGISILTISLSQSGLNEALKKQDPEINPEELTNTEYKELAVNYVKEHFELSVNGEAIELLEGGIKLGNHETGMKFITTTLPSTFETLNVRIKAFSENENHQTIFSLLLNGTTSKVILSQHNNYSADVVFKDDMMVVNSQTFNKNYLWCFVIIPLYFIGKKLLSK